MILKWRGKDYNFINRCNEGHRDSTNAGAKITIDKNIYAFDTESVALKDRYEPICFQVSSPFEGEELIYLEERANALRVFLDFIVKRYSWREFRNKDMFMYAHNLIYDWGQLVKYNPSLLEIARTGIGIDDDLMLYKTQDYKVTFKSGGLFVGTSPFFSINIYMSKREQFNILFRDTFSFFPSSLAKITKNLGLVEKMERQEGLGMIDYRKLPDNNDNKIYFEEYGKIDALATRLTAEKIRTLHEISHMQRIRISAPSFAINKLYHVIPEGTKIISGVNDPSIMQLIMDSYNGGRTGGIYHGKVNNLWVYDFHSSYPSSMTTLPSFSETMEYIRHPDPENIELDELMEIMNEQHCFVRLDGIEHDNKYPSLITNVNNKLTPIYGKFKDIATTGVELYTGIKSGGIEVINIKELVILVDMEDDVILPFKEFIESAYDRKKNADNTNIDYSSAKLEMNSSYGKLIESRSETPVYGSVGNIILPYLKGFEYDFGHDYYNAYINSVNEGTRFVDDVEVMIDECLNNFGDELEYATLKKLSLTKLEYGRFVIPAGASLITGTSRARLLALIKSTKALYWDTDSAFINNLTSDSLNQSLSLGGSWLPDFVPKLSIGNELGELDSEITNADGYLAGVKRYYLESKDNGDIKKAVHGIQGVPYDKIMDILKRLATGENIKYTSKPKPNTLKTSDTIEDIGKFESREFESKFSLDNRLNWIKDSNGWNGTIKLFSEVINN